ncbi:DUF402 domain-containing protein [Marvinbryantia sp.]|uniref:DUF402 domain-containing protein n=1 Tax=Marvinbryantia sp. TaxID=2496532 RepID=UPI00260105E0|nr:DUF402 domain-containing protein [uncultured Marvinbryantia sp.]
MQKPVLYRKRLIPDECILLKNDEILHAEENLIVTKWNTLRPKKELSHGLSAFFLDRGIKISKFYNHAGELICWYCDIITYTYDRDTDTYVMTDLLADVLVYPDGTVKVVDLDELALAAEKKLISEEQLLIALRQLDWLLQTIYSGSFRKLLQYVDQFCPNNRFS